MATNRDPRTKQGQYVDSEGYALTKAITETEAQFATENGNAYNLNTKLIGLTSSTESGVFYYKHKQDNILIVESLVLYLGDGAGAVRSGDAEWTVVLNPTGGTLITNAVAISVDRNRRASSNNLLGDDSDIYQGVEGDTLTGGDEYIFVAGGAGRTPLTINTEVDKNDSIAVKVDTNTTAGTSNVYVAMICHTKAI